MNEPILRQRALPAGGSTLGERVPMTITVYGGLHMIRGNAAPYFSLTYWAHRKGHPSQRQQGGAGHDVILKLYPELADLAALHLSDIDGVPMHAEANGWYWLAGALGGLGERYHGGNGYSAKSQSECLDIFARHCRIDFAEAQRVRGAIRGAMSGTTTREEAHAAARREWDQIMETMRPRWKAEAEAAIERHGLEVYGDPWPAPGSGQAIEEKEVRA